MSAKYPICADCYFNNRAPEICESCTSGSEFEPAIDQTTPRGKPIKVYRIKKVSDYED